jgi:hypothetical protein
MSPRRRSLNVTKNNCDRWKAAEPNKGLLTEIDLRNELKCWMKSVDLYIYKVF